MNPILQSSQDPNELSMTIQGVLIALVPLAIALFQVNGIDVADTQLINVIQEFTAIVASVTMVFGAIRKFINLIKDTFVSQ